MCGIFCSVSYGEEPCPSCCPNVELIHLNQMLQRRGPEESSQDCICMPLPLGGMDMSGTYSIANIHLAGHVLWTRGPQPELQPYQSENEFMLFNGDIYSFGDQDSSSSATVNMNYKENDGLQLFQILQSTEDIQKSISQLRGPYAIIYLNLLTNELWFCRDFFGRSSLVLSFDSNSTMYISSVSNLTTVFEIPTSGIFCLNVFTKTLTLYPWDSHCRKDINELTQQFADLMRSHGFSFQEEGQRKVPCLSTSLLEVNSSSCPEQFESESMTMADPAEQLIMVSDILQDYISDLLVHLRSSVRQRVELKPPVCKNCSVGANCDHAKISVLFSGGLDSTVLAFLAAEILNPGETLHLINVAFYQDKGKEKVKGNDPTSTVPDRLTGLESYKILREIFEPKGIIINFIPVDITKSAVQEMRNARIRDLISPLTSVLDDSLGCCLWFAAKESTARIVLLGSGADELFGGYGRHRSAFESRGWEGLSQEMQNELDRISVRNMGRDNRIVSDHGLVPRIPFLDENVVQFLTKCPVWVKCSPLKSLQRGVGEKILLRATAMKLLGAKNAHIALFPKRAMQFGSRIAKLENSKEKGGDVCRRLQKNS